MSLLNSGGDVGWGKTTAAKLEKQIYTIREVAGLMGFSRTTVARLFENERGVIILTAPARKDRKRAAKRSIRIPRAVYERVIDKLTVK
ncbi:MAG: hypothetical protein ACLPY1_00365 [Terracidiphilus sp.]